jgi:hypothetical protein
MEGWRQRRLGEKVRIHREKNKNVLTPTGLRILGEITSELPVIRRDQK